MVRRSPTGACQCARVLAMPRNPRSSRLATWTSSSASSSPASVRSSCSWQLPGQPPSTHSRSPWMVATATPWAVWACRLASSSTFWLPHSLGRCTRVASPSTSTASPLAVISASQQPSSAVVVMKLPSGWQKPRAASGPSSRSRLSPTSVLEMPTARPARRYDSPSSSTAATASRRTSNASGGVPPWPGGRGGARRAASQASTCAGSEERGQYDKGTRPPGGRETPCPWSGPRQRPAAQAITDTLIDTRGPMEPSRLRPLGIDHLDGFDLGVCRPPHGLVDLLHRGAEFDLGQAFLLGRQGNGDTDRRGDQAQVLHRWQERRPERHGVGKFGDRVSG